MKKDLTELVFILDRSGSMSGLEGDTIGGYNAMLEKQKKEQGEAVITTDGMENASREYSYEKVRRMIEHQKSKHGWEFIFLGANIDAVDTAERFGIGQDRAVNYNADSDGTLLNYEVISETVSCLRADRKISKDWKDRIEEDFRKRGGRR